jgi:hypothetical protein
MSTIYYQGCHTGRPEAFWRANRAGGPVHYALYEPGGVLYTEKLLFQIYFTVVTFLTISRRRGHVEDGSLRYLPTEVCRRPFDPFIYHRRSVNAHLTLIGRARRSIGRIGRAGGPPHRQPCILYEYCTIYETIQFVRLYRTR